MNMNILLHSLITNYHCVIVFKSVIACIVRILMFMYGKQDLCIN